MSAVTRTRQRSAQRAFTLLELLVVVVIIGIVAAGAMLSLSSTGNDSQLQQERDRLAALIPYVRERGAMLTLEYGIRCGQHGYRFVVYDNRTLQWLPDTVDDTLRLRRLPPGLQLQLVIEGRPVVLDDKALTIPKSKSTQLGGTISTLGSGIVSLGGETTDNTPQIMLLSNGDINSFALTLVREGVNRSATLQSTEDGDVQFGDVVEPKR